MMKNDDNDDANVDYNHDNNNNNDERYVNVLCLLNKAKMKILKQI